MAAHQKKPPSAFRKSSCSLRYCFRVWMPNHICRQAENEDEDRWGSMRIRRIGSMETTQHAYLTWFHWSLHNEQRILSAAHGLGMSTPNVFGTQVKSSCISRSVPAQPHVAMHYFRQYIYRIYTQCLLVRVSQLQRDPPVKPQLCLIISTLWTSLLCSYLPRQQASCSVQAEYLYHCTSIQQMLRGSVDTYLYIYIYTYIHI